MPRLLHPSNKTLWMLSLERGGAWPFEFLLSTDELIQPTGTINIFHSSLQPVRERTRAF